MTASSRDIVLNRIRAATGNGGQADASQVQQRLSSPPVMTRPAIAGGLLARFEAKACANLCSISRVASDDDVVSAVDRILRERNLPRDISVSGAFRDFPWPGFLNVRSGEAGRLEEMVCVTDASVGIAETGSLVFFSEKQRPAGLNFLPELHIAVLHTRDIVGHIEDIWPVARALPVWPRALNIVSGPSRTADVAQIIVRPAHGPKSLHILLREDP